MVNVHDLMDTPFVPGGREIGKGLDCWGLYIEVMKRFGVNVPDFQISCFAADLVNQEKLEVTKNLMEPVAHPVPGDGVAMAIHPEAPDMVQHFGVMVDKRRFIHTIQKIGPMLTRLDAFWWSNKIRGFYRWKK
jgi:cell wall-associated NlpC family hydrolase